MRKLLSFVLAVLTTAAILAGCGGSAKLAEGFDETAVKAAAESAVTTLNGGDYDAFCALGADSLQGALTPAVIKNAVAQVMPDAGEFVEFSSETMSTAKDSDGNDNAVVVIVAKYEKQNVTYTVSLNKDLLLTGFYLK